MISEYCFRMLIRLCLLILIINVFLADDKNKSGTEIQMNKDVKQHKPSEEYTSECMQVVIYLFMFVRAPFGYRKER